MTTAPRLPEPCAAGSGTGPADILERVLDKGVVVAGGLMLRVADVDPVRILPPPGSGLRLPAGSRPAAGTGRC